MKELLIILFTVLGFSQVNWDIEKIDSTVYVGNEFDYIHNFLTLDENDTPHIIYNKSDKIIYATKVDTGWRKELVETGFFYTCFSLVFDENNNAHLSYYRKDDGINVTYLCYARRDSTDWIIDVVDSIYGIITNYWFSWGYYQTSIALDTCNLPGIAYTSWNLSDSLHYVKYAHYNGMGWDTSIVEYDSVWHHTLPSDWSPSLKCDCENRPWVAFYHNLNERGNQDRDTIKIAYYDDTLNQWIVNPAICNPYGCSSISLALDSQSYPCIAHGWDAFLAYSFWDGLSWHTESTGADMGWSGKIDLDLDALDSPHIAFRGDLLMPSPNYCYRNYNWYIYWQFDSLATAGHDISLDLDENDEPHISYHFSYSEDHGVKYAKGTFVGIEEDIRNSNLKTKVPQIEIVPNLVKRLLNVRYIVNHTKQIKLSLYDATGSRVKILKQGKIPPGHYQERIDVENLSSGIYFVVLKQGAEMMSTKFLMIK